MYPNQGNIKRAKPRLQILRGNAAGESSMASAAYPVTAGVTIRSGMVIYPNWVAGNSRYEWALGLSAGGIGYFATADSADQDVISAGKLVGLSCAGQYELTTGYFAAGTYNLGAFVSANGSGELVEVALNGGGAAAPIIGRISRIFPSAPSATTGVPAASNAGGAGYSVDSGATSTLVLAIETMSLPANTGAQ
jgi:hypothetical protein